MILIPVCWKLSSALCLLSAFLSCGVWCYILVVCLSFGHVVSSQINGFTSLHRFQETLDVNTTEDGPARSVEEDGSEVDASVERKAEGKCMPVTL